MVISEWGSKIVQRNVKLGVLCQIRCTESHFSWTFHSSLWKKKSNFTSVAEIWGEGFKYDPHVLPLLTMRKGKSRMKKKKIYLCLTHLEGTKLVSVITLDLQ